MALRTTTDIDVDFYDKKYILINAKQNDKKSRFLSVTCYNHGKLYPINSVEYSAYIRYKKADGHSVFNFCEIDGNRKIIIELTEQMLAADGICYADLVLVSKGKAEVKSDTGEIIAIDDTGILSTMTFCIDVSETAIENSEIETSKEFIQFNEALETYWADFEDVMKTSKSWAVGYTGIREGENTNNAEYYYKLSKSYAVGDASNIRDNENVDNSKYYYELSDISKTNAAESANSASDSATNASKSAQSASDSADRASKSAEIALDSESAAKDYMEAAIENKDLILSSAESVAENKAKTEEYYLQVIDVANGLSGALHPQGTITFSELEILYTNGEVEAGDLYHINDNFTTTEIFKKPNIEHGAGTNVYCTSNGLLDCLVGTTTVAGVKGDKEIEYRDGNVNITAENVGAIPTADIVTVNEMKNYLGI